MKLAHELDPVLVHLLLILEESESVRDVIAELLVLACDCMHWFIVNFPPISREGACSQQAAQWTVISQTSLRGRQYYAIYTNCYE